MPKFGSHIIFADLAKAKRPDLFPDHSSNAYHFGAVGPDTTLFMFDPATKNPSLRKGILAAMDVLDSIRRIKDTLKEIEETLTKPVDDIADWLTGGLSKDIKYTLNTSLEALFLAAKLGFAWGVSGVNVKNPLFGKLGDLPKDFIKDPAHAAQFWSISSSDNFGFPFRMFGHPFTDDGTWKQPLQPGNYAEWWWMDMLHYRRTGSFAKKLLQNAQSNVQKSYARGYMTHVAGDICGHPFINGLVDGPFRNHAYRHLVLETLADTWLWGNQGQGDILGSNLDRLINVSISDSKDIASLVIKTMREVYHPPMVPSLLANGYPTEEEFEFAYRFMQNYLRMSTDASVRRPTPPPDSIKEVLKEIKDLLKNNNPGSFPNWNGSIEDFLEALFSWFGKGLTLLVMIATLPYAVLVRLVTVAPRWVLYLINLALYYLVSAIRTMLCWTGWGYCSIEDFENFGFMDHWIEANPSDGAVYPQSNTSIPKPPFYWLDRPRRMGSKLELKPTVAMLPNRQARPSWMVDPANTMDLASVMALGTALTPDDARAIQMALIGQQVFGNAVDYSIGLLDGVVPAYDFDLDGDRGAGFRGWEVLPPSEVYVDSPIIT